MESTIFKHPTFGQVRTTGTPEQPLFCANDVCKALGYSNGRDALTRHVDDPDVVKCDIGVQTGVKADGTPAMQKVAMSFVNESGLYSLIFGSKLDDAKEFKRWVTSEVLPSIRKSGGYMAASPDETPEQIMARALLLANETLARRNEELAKANQRVETLQQTLAITKESMEVNAQLAAQANQRWIDAEKHLQNEKMRAQAFEEQAETQAEEIRKMQPMADYANSVLQSTSTFTLTQVSKDLGFRNVNLFTKWCEKLRILYRQSGMWMPHSRFSGTGSFVTRTHKYVKSDNTIGSSMYTVVTEAGRAMLHAVLNKRGYNPA